MKKPTEDADIALLCVDCGTEFVFTADEQRYFRSKQLSIPKRCPACRAERRARLVPDRAVHHD